VCDPVKTVSVARAIVAAKVKAEDDPRLVERGFLAALKAARRRMMSGIRRQKPHKFGGGNGLGLSWLLKEQRCPLSGVRGRAGISGVGKDGVGGTGG
jgi:hypothetical protein